MGLFNPGSRDEQARFLYCENARFREDLRENTRKSEVLLSDIFSNIMELEEIMAL